MKKVIYIDGRKYGVIGEKVPNHLYEGNYDLHVGDVIQIRLNEKIINSPILNYNDAYGIYGLEVCELNYQDIHKVLSYKNLTFDIFLELLNCYSFKFREIK